MTWSSGVDAFCIKHGLDEEDRRVMHGILKQAFTPAGFGNLNEALGKHVYGPTPAPVNPPSGEPETTLNQLRQKADTTPAPQPAPGVPATKRPPAPVGGAKDYTVPDYSGIRPARPLWDQFLAKPSFSSAWNLAGQGLGRALKIAPTEEEQRVAMERSNRESNADTAAAGYAAAIRRLNDPEENRRYHRGDEKAMAAGRITDRERINRLEGKELPPNIADMEAAVMRGDYSGAARPEFGAKFKYYTDIIKDENVPPERRDHARQLLQQAMATNFKVQRLDDQFPELSMSGGHRAVRAAVRASGLPRQYFSGRPEYQRAPVREPYKPPFYRQPAEGQLPQQPQQPQQPQPPQQSQAIAPPAPTEPAAPTPLPGRAAEPQIAQQPPQQIRTRSA